MLSNSGTCSLSLVLKARQNCRVFFSRWQTDVRARNTNKVVQRRRHLFWRPDHSRITVFLHAVLSNASVRTEMDINRSARTSIATFLVGLTPCDDHWHNLLLDARNKLAHVHIFFGLGHNEALAFISPSRIGCPNSNKLASSSLPVVLAATSVAIYTAFQCDLVDNEFSSRNEHEQECMNQHNHDSSQAYASRRPSAQPFGSVTSAFRHIRVFFLRRRSFDDVNKFSCAHSWCMPTCIRTDLYGD